MEPYQSRRAANALVGSCYCETKKNTSMIGRGNQVRYLFFVIGGFVLSVMFYRVWIHGSVHKDFYPLWAGTRLAVFQHLPIYSVMTTRRIQILLYGRVLPPSADQQAFAYPAILAVILIPFASIRNREIATLLWVALSVNVVVCGSFMVLVHRKNLSVSGMLFTLTWPFLMLSLYQCQVEAFLGGMLLWAVWAYEKQHDRLSGFFAAFLLIKPQLGLVPVMVLLAWSYVKQRYGVYVGFVGTLTLLLVASVILLGFWIPSWFVAISYYQSYAQVNWMFRDVYRETPTLALVIMAIIVAIVYRQRSNFLASVSLSVIAMYILMPQTPIWSLGFQSSVIPLEWNRGNKRLFWGLWILGWFSFVLYCQQPSGWKIYTWLFSLLVFIGISLSSFSRSHT